jgi:hypothetical protein
VLKKRLVKLLRDHKTTIGWTLATSRTLVPEYLSINTIGAQCKTNKENAKKVESTYDGGSES